jgi:hypothetical protein
MSSIVGLWFLLGVVALLATSRLREQDGWRFHWGEAASSSFPIPIGIAMPVVISVILFLTSLCVILLSTYQAEDKHWAYGTVGTLVGYWLRPQEKGR